MTEEQFWHSNPRIIAVWEKAYKEKVNSINDIIHNIVGNYGISALIYSIEHCFAKNPKYSYVEKPIKLFELTEEEKEREAVKEQKIEQNKFIEWAKSFMKKKQGKEDE